MLDFGDFDDRLRLFHFTAWDNRDEYVALLRAVDRARSQYQATVHVADVRSLVFEMIGVELEARRLVDMLDNLVDLRVLTSASDTGRAATIAELRNRNSVYQFTELGYRAYHAVEDILSARVSDAGLSRVALEGVLGDLRVLAQAVRAGDEEQVYLVLSRLDNALTGLMQRAAVFYLLLGELSRAADASPEMFLAHKYALLRHMEEFSAKLEVLAPRLRDAVAEVRASGVDKLLDYVCLADDRVFASPDARRQDWVARWSGIEAWFSAGTGRSEAERLQSATITAIGETIALLRRVTDARRGGVSRCTQLRHVAAWFARLPSDDIAHGMFQVVFTLRASRHLSVDHDDQELIPSRRSWWDAPSVDVAKKVARYGKRSSPGRPGALRSNPAVQRRLRERQLADDAARRAAAERLALGLDDLVLDRAQTRVLLGLLDLALAARAPVAGDVVSTASAHGLRLVLTPCAETTVVRTRDGNLVLDGVRVEVRASSNGTARPPRPDAPAAPRSEAAEPLKSFDAARPAMPIRDGRGRT